MADVDSSGGGAPGIKLFGTTIAPQVKGVEVKKPAKADDTNEKRAEKTIPCPRCKSMDTKFCYFNNYNVNQPRHFCKACQRYWTAGGTLRNVPIGAGRRKNKPPSQGTIGFPNNCVFDASGVNQFDFEGVMEQWSIATARGGFRQVFPSKRRSNTSSGQIC
ncbi:PREDICTED: dof zinc finger protein DOF1.5-like [Nelumbo nucifera]|uniref:Dof-type domain-containing protein n=2 Tax=Nelumbo nucifera TaxID=4432 RepID=A0A822XNC2_NELNU|nr:PREDICTED: dof zinc finger protein DOF1.5-like [Nelumbo nucifera]DAD21203.1 TPA_asm: hypothetical protein HUJ06_022666 [Nelumbo nucifera]